MADAAVLDAINNASSYVWGQCTFYAAQVASWVPAGLGNAGEWLGNAQRKGLATSSTPVAGSVVVYGAGGGYSSFGHVAVVTGVHSDGTFDVSEMNYKGINVISQRVSDMRDVLGFILPPLGAQLKLPLTGLLGAAAGAVLPSSSSSRGSPGCSLLDVGCWLKDVENLAQRAMFIWLGLVLVLIGLFLLVVEDAEEKALEVVEKAAPLAAAA